MKRYFFFLVLLIALIGIFHGKRQQPLLPLNFSTVAALTEKSKRTRPIAHTNTQASSSKNNNFPLSPENAFSREPLTEKETGERDTACASDSNDDNRLTMYELFKKQFDPSHQSDVVGKVSLSYGSYEAKFNVEFHIPKASDESTQVPLLLNGGIAMASLDSFSPNENSLGVSFAGLPIRPLLSLNPNSAADQIPDLNDITLIYFSIAPNQKKDTSPVFAHFNYDTKEKGKPLTRVGKLEYSIVNN